MSESTAPKVLGYRKKPLWIPLVGLIFCLSPFGNFLLSLAARNIQNWWTPATWNYWWHYIPFHAWMITLAVFGSGICLIFFVRKWALMLTASTIAIVMAYNLILFPTFKMMGTVVVLTMIFTTAFAGYIVWFTSFRKPYENPKIRWWESHERYRVHIPVSFANNSPTATLLDISLTGALIEWATVAEVPPPDRVTSMRLSPEVELDCRVVRITERGFGVLFSERKKPQIKAFKRWIKQLKKQRSTVSNPY
jgi:hypothetical protein